MHHTRRLLRTVCLVAAVSAGTAVTARAAHDLRFDVVTFNATPEGYPDHMNQTLFNDLNYTSINGHNIMMGSDAHRPELTAAGNALGAYYNTWTSLYNGQTVKDGFAAADTINAYVNRFTTNGARPDWVSLNELSGSLWPRNATYRQWTIDCVTKLHDTYGLNVIAYSPFPNPAGNDASWQLLSAKAYVGIEYYLSGAEVRSHGFSLSWVQSQYQSAINSYSNRGVPKDHMILGEEFAQTTAGTGWGRAGVPLADWEATIRVRSQALYNLDFTGFIGYAWGKNAMGVSDAEMRYAEDVYRSTLVLRSERPHWLGSGGGSWSVRNNWIAYATVPTNPGDAATFDKTITAASATITLDGDHAVGSLTFNTPHPVTVAAGSGGTLTLDNNGAAPAIVVSQGFHTTAAPLAFAAPATLTISAGAGLDVTTNTLLLEVPPATVRQYLYDSRLTSSTSAADPGGRLALGYATDPSTGAVTVETTYLGDANLDGRVDADDYVLTDRGFARHLSDWSDGDFNYDGIVDQQDYLLIDVTYGQLQCLSLDLLSMRESQFGEAYVAQLLSSLPEPSALLSLIFPLIFRHRGSRR